MYGEAGLMSEGSDKANDQQIAEVTGACEP